MAKLLADLNEHLYAQMERLMNKNYLGTPPVLVEPNRSPRFPSGWWILPSLVFGVAFWVGFTWAVMS